jgi:hypothetical protein
MAMKYPKKDAYFWVLVAAVVAMILLSLWIIFFSKLE